MFEEPSQNNVRRGYFLLTDELIKLTIYKTTEHGVWAKNDNRNVFSPYSRSVIRTEENEGKRFTLVGKEINKERLDLIENQIEELEKKS